MGETHEWAPERPGLPPRIFKRHPDQDEPERITLYRCPRCGLVDADEFPRASGLDDTEAEGLMLCGSCPADDAHEPDSPKESGGAVRVVTIVPLYTRCSLGEAELRAWRRGRR